MARYEVFPGPGIGNLLLDVQADLLDDISTRVVVPLLEKSKAPLPTRKLNPEFSIDGKPYIMMPQFLATVPASSLRNPVTSLSDRFAEISAALDFLFQGY